MIPICSRQQMRAFDQRVIEHYKIPGLLLMENAGRGSVDQLSRCTEIKNKNCIAIAGTGNNGGDGFVVARHLWARAARVQVFLIGDATQIQGDARVNYEAWIRLGGSCTSVSPNSDLRVLQEQLVQCDWILDALFGTGLDRPLSPFVISIIESINQSTARRFSIDIPSGLNADTGMPMGACVHAEETACLGQLKLGLLTPQGAHYAGRVHVVDLGVPDSILHDVGFAAEALEPSDIASWLPVKSTQTHKYSAGAVLIGAGSIGKSGAALLCARGAFRAGAGLVTLATWPEAIAAIDAKIHELLTLQIDRSTLWAPIEPLLHKYKSIVLGPGFGLDEDAENFIQQALRVFHGPIVLDADALTLLAHNREIVKHSKASLILTPHSGELARLLACSTADIESNRVEAAKQLAQTTHAIVVLKGNHSVIASPQGRIAINTTGNSLLATAGSGDVLAGMIGAFACSRSAFEAACAGVYIHGLAADLLSNTMGDRGALASEIADSVPRAIRTVLNTPLAPFQ